MGAWLSSLTAQILILRGVVKMGNIKFRQQTTTRRGTDPIRPRFALPVASTLSDETSVSVPQCST